MAAGVRDIKIRFSGDSSGLAKAAKDGEASVGRFSGRTQKVAKVALAGVAAFGVGMVAVLKNGVQGLQEGEEAEARFADAIGRSTPRIRGQADAFKAYAEQVQRNTRFTYEDTLAAGSLLAAQDGVQQAIRNGTTTLQGATQVVLDMATAQNVDASTAAKSYAKALAAPERAAALLRKSGVNLTVQQQEQIKAFVKAGETGKAQAIIQEELRKKFEGSAKAAGETTAGQMIRAQNAFGEVQEQLAVGLLPVLTDLLSWLVRVTAWAQDNPAKVKIVVITLASLAAVIGTISLAITAWTAITRTATAVQAVWNAVMAANPIVLITLAIVGLIAVIVLIATRTTWFQQLWKAAWSGIQKAVGAVFSWVQNNWPLLLAILTGPFGLAVLAIAKNWDRVVSTVQGIPGRIKSALGDMLGLLKPAGEDLVRGMVEGIKSGAGWLAAAIKEQLVDKPKHLITHPWEILSPSKVTARYGKYITEGFIEGIKLTGPRLLEAQQALQDKLRAKVDKAKDLAKSIRDAFRFDLSATSVDSETGERGTSIFDRLRQQADQAEQFTRTIQSLRKAGLREDLLSQLTGEGPGSLSSALELASNVGAANQLAGRISSAGSSLGASEALANTGINIEAPIVKVSVQLDGKEIKALVKAEVEAKAKATKSSVAAGSKRSAA